jgi:hypothetical protein
MCVVHHVAARRFIETIDRAPLVGFPLVNCLKSQILRYVWFPLVNPLIRLMLHICHI